VSILDSLGKLKKLLSDNNSVLRIVSSEKIGSEVRLV
jgi:hypothetical protein